MLQSTFTAQTLILLSYIDNFIFTKRVSLCLCRYARKLYEWMVPAYIPAPFVLVRGEGSRLWDQQGKSTLILLAGIAVNALGQASALREALNEQANRFLAYRGTVTPMNRRCDCL